MDNASLIPHQLFGDNGLIADIGEIAVPIITSISKRANMNRHAATLSLGLIMDDFSINKRNTYFKKRLIEGIQGLSDCGIIDLEDIAQYKINDAFDINLYYDFEPFVKLYDYEFAVLGSYTQADNIKLTMVYLFMMKHINDKTKEPTWISVEAIAEEFDFAMNTVRKYIKILIEDLGILFRKGKRHTANGFCHLHTRNMPEYIHLHKDI